MSLRFPRLAVLSACGALILLNPCLLDAAQAQGTPPHMFSSWYAEALRDILQLEESSVARLEQKLAENPLDSATRLKLMAYHQRADRVALRADRAKRLELVLWLVQHHPDSELLHSPFAKFGKGELSVDDFSRASTLWDAVTKAHSAKATVQWHAASFFEGLDPGLYLQYLENTATADPNHAFALRPLAHLYALSILEQGPLASRAVAGLEKSKNVWVLGNAAYLFQSRYNESLQRGTPNETAAKLAERYFQRARILDPKLDRQAILPQIDLQSIGRARQEEAHAQQNWKARAVEAVANLRRLPIEAFPSVPQPLAAILRSQNCRVPQPSGNGTPRNVIRGEFVAKGETGWAVLCSVNSSTVLLVFRNAGDTNPYRLDTSEDRAHIQDLGGGSLGYSREIGAAGRDSIMRYYRAYGGPEPPPIDHQGIEDVFLEKASTIWYFYAGKWLQLQGSD